MTKNKRAEQDPAFAELILAIGNGTYGKTTIQYCGQNESTTENQEIDQYPHPASIDIPKDFLLASDNNSEDLVE